MPLSVVGWPLDGAGDKLDMGTRDLLSEGLFFRTSSIFHDIKNPAVPRGRLELTPFPIQHPSEQSIYRRWRIAQRHILGTPAAGVTTLPALPPVRDVCYRVDAAGPGARDRSAVLSKLQQADVAHPSHTTVRPS